MSKVNATGALVIQKDKKVNTNVPFPTMFVGALSIYIMALPLVVLDLFIIQYQAIYFTIMGIPKIDREDFVVMDRSKLNGLTSMQKINCVYCEYANGMIAFAKAVTNQTEIYSCAIKHSVSAQGQEHQKDFYQYEEFLNPVDPQEDLSINT